MDIKISAKIASLALYTSGFISGFIGISSVIWFSLFNPPLPEARDIVWIPVFIVIIFSLFELVAGYGVWSMKKGGIILGIVLSIIPFLLGLPMLFRDVWKHIWTNIVTVWTIIGSVAIQPFPFVAGIYGFIVGFTLAAIALVFLLFTWLGSKKKLFYGILGITSITIVAIIGVGVLTYMSKPKLSIEDVKARHETSLMNIPGVVGVGIGECDSDELVVLLPCIKVYLEKETPESKRIPKKLEGYKVDVEIIGPIEALEE